MTPLELVAIKPSKERLLPRPNPLRLKRLRTMTTTTCTFVCRARVGQQCISGLLSRYSARFPKALSIRMPPHIELRSGANAGKIAPQQRRRETSSLYSALVAVVQPGICGDMIVYSAENDPHVQGLTKYFAGCVAVPGTSTAAEVEVFVDCHRVSCATAIFDYRNMG